VVGGQGARDASRSRTRGRIDAEAAQQPDHHPVVNLEQPDQEVGAVEPGPMPGLRGAPRTVQRLLGARGHAQAAQRAAGQPAPGQPAPGVDPVDQVHPGTVWSAHGGQVEPLRPPLSRVTARLNGRPGGWTRASQGAADPRPARSTTSSGLPS
jgi:hypothetical protein